MAVVECVLYAICTYYIYWSIEAGVIGEKIKQRWWPRNDDNRVLSFNNAHSAMPGMGQPFIVLASAVLAVMWVCSMIHWVNRWPAGWTILSQRGHTHSTNTRTHARAPQPFSFVNIFSFLSNNNNKMIFRISTTTTKVASIVSRQHGLCENSKRGQYLLAFPHCECAIRSETRCVVFSKEHDMKCKAVRKWHAWCIVWGKNCVFCISFTAITCIFRGFINFIYYCTFTMCLPLTLYVFYAASYLFIHP